MVCGVERASECGSDLRAEAARSTLLFFFQAEDGIRDSSVTGVQTCALPIPLASKPANFVKRIGDWMVAINPASKLRAKTFHCFDVVTVPLSTRRLRTSPEESALSARKFLLCCGIRTRLGLGPSSMD